MPGIGTDIQYAKACLQQGLLVGLPTETVYGLAANALDPAAVAGIFEAKNRPFFDPLIIHVGSLEQALRYVREFPTALKQLAEAFWPGPLTLLLPKQNNIPDLVTSGLDRVAVRLPAHALTQQLLLSLDFPLAAPSANPFGYISPTTARHVEKQLGHKVAYILDGGPSPVGLESTIVGLEGDQLTVYRLGGLSLEAIEAVAGKVSVQLNQSSNPAAPGQLKSHYAPRKPLIIGPLRELEQNHINERPGILSFGHYVPLSDTTLVRSLSETKNTKEAATRLFALLRELDESEASIILTELLPEEGLGKAINDRLRRASSTEF